jgi:hypothetical protein
MIPFINQYIQKTSIYNIGKGIFWIVLALCLAFIFNIWYKAPSGSYLWIGIFIFDILFVFMAVAGVWEIVMSIKYLINPITHEVYKLLKKYERQPNLYENVNQELKQLTKPFSNTVLTENWLIKNSRFDIEFINISDIAWVYEKKITTTLNTIIPVGMDFCIVIHTLKAQVVEIPIKQIEVSQFLQLLQNLNENSRLGCSEENKVWWELKKKAL